MDVVDGVEDDGTELVGRDADGVLVRQVLAHVLLSTAVVGTVRRTDVQYLT